MMKKKWLFYMYAAWVLFLVASCTKRNSKLESVLSSAKENRSELQKVLEYYKNDSLKLEAAKYLISNHDWGIRNRFKYAKSILRILSDLL